MNIGEVGCAVELVVDEETGVERGGSGAAA